MEQNASDAASKDAQTILNKEEYVSRMEQNASDAASKDAQTILNKEEYVSSTEQNASDAALKDAQSILKKEECALSIDQRNKRLGREYNKMHQDGKGRVASSMAKLGRQSGL